MPVLLFEYKVKRSYKLKHFYLDSHIPLFCFSFSLWPLQF